MNICINPPVGRISAFVEAKLTPFFRKWNILVAARPGRKREKELEIERGSVFERIRNREKGCKIDPFLWKMEHSCCSPAREKGRERKN